VRCCPLLLLVACTGGPPVVLDTDTDTEPPPRTAPALACDDTPESASAWPDPRPELDASPPGTVLRCAPDGGRSRADLAQRLDGLPVDVRSGYLAWRLGIRTRRAPIGDASHVDALTTARVLVPESPLPGPQPLIVVASDLAGLHDDCAPSLDPDGVTAVDALVRSWAAQGVPVLLVDGAGLGTADLPGVGHAPDTARSVLDAARGALTVLRPELASGSVVLLGHGEGAGAVIGARVLALDLAPELDLTDVIAVGGGIALADPTPRWRLANLDLSGADGFDRAREVLALQADLALTQGEQARDQAFGADLREPLLDFSDTRCGADLVTALATPTQTYEPPDTIGQLLDPDFRLAIVGCVDRTDRCTPQAQAVVDRRRAGVLRDLDQGPDLLLVGGEHDTRHDRTDQSCLAEATAASGVCVLPQADRAALPTAALPVLLDRVGLAGGAACPDLVELPRCPF